MWDVAGNRSTAAEEVRLDGTAPRVELEAEARLVYMVYHRNNYLTPAVKNYIQHVLDKGPGFSGVPT